MKKAFLLPAFLFLMAAQAQAQEWTLERANRLLDTLQMHFRQTPETPFPDPLNKQLNEALSALMPPASSDTLLAASLLYFRSSHLVVTANMDASQADLEKIKSLLQFRQDSIQDSTSLDLLGSAWQMEHINYTNFKFDFMRAKRAAEMADAYFKKCKNKFAVTQTGAGMAFLSVKCGRCGEGETLVQRARRAYLALTDEQKAQDPTFEFYIPYISGNSQLCLGDSLRLAGEPEAANAAYRRALNEYAQLDTARSPSWVRGIFDFVAGRCHLYTQPTDAGSSVLHLTRAVAAFKENGMGDQAGVASATLGWATVMTGAARREAGLKLIVEGLNALGYPVTTIYDQTLPQPERYKTLLVQALSAKAAALLYLYEAGGGTQRDLEQSLRDSEMAGDILRNLQADMDKNDQASFELAAGVFGQIFAVGAYIAAKLYHSTRQQDYLSRALTLADQGKNFTLWMTLREKTLDGTAIPRNMILEGKITLTRTQALLDDSTALLEYVVLPTRESCIIWVTKKGGGVEFLTKLSEWKKPAERFVSLLDSLSAGASEDVLWKLSVQLRPTLLSGSLLRQLGPNIQHLVIVRDNLLWGMNFDLLVEPTKPLNPDARAYSCLIEHYATSYPYSLNVLRISSEGIGDRNLEAFTANYGDNKRVCSISTQPLRSLSEMCAAAKKIAALWNPPQKRGLYDAITRDSFEERLQYADIALIVMHGCAGPDQSPMDYELAFSDKNLALREIYDFKNVRAKLIFMGVCNTAWGQLLQGEGQACISRAFAFKGCPTLISAVARVPGRTTAVLMEDFFAHFKSGTNAAQSLRKAKLRQLESSPHLWANLLCLGNGGIRLE